MTNTAEYIDVAVGSVRLGRERAIGKDDDVLDNGHGLTH